MIITGKKFSKPEMSRVINGDRQLQAGAEKPQKSRLDHLLIAKYPDFKRSTLQKFIREGRASAGGEVITKPNTLLPPDTEIVLSLPADLANPATRQAQVAAARPATIYEDANVLVLDKPAGLLSMAKGEYCPEPTLQDYGLLVHRLDRATSGVVILAKNPTVQSMLRRQFQERRAHKTYYALVAGRPQLDEAIINLPLARNLKRPTTFQVDPSGKPAETYYRVAKSTMLSTTQATALGLKPGQIVSLLELKPRTGRTHQLRIHLAHIGTPIIGDPVYGSAKTAKSDKSTAAPRLFLHAFSLEITIPSPNPAESAANERRTFTAPLPPEFTHVF